MSCSSCGKEVVPISQICVHCGAPHRQAIAAALPAGIPQRTTTARIVVYCFWGLLGALVFIGIVNRVVDVSQPKTSVIARTDVSQTRSSVADPFEPGRKIVIPNVVSCTPQLDDFNLMVTAIWNEDKPALMSLWRQGRLIYIDPGESAEVVFTNPAKHRTSIYVGSGEQIGRTCYVVTEMIEVNHAQGQEQ